jgi:hypothetical protein
MKPGKTMKLLLEFAKDGNVMASAYCIRTDAWQDHLGLLEDARSASKIGNKRKSNRFLRASLIFLLAHLESSLAACLLAVKYKPKEKICRASLDTKINMINAYLSSNRNSVSLDVKEPCDLRNIIAHADAFRSGGKLNEVDVFEKLTVGYLRKTSSGIDIFLNRVCKVCAVERFGDTAQELKIISTTLGKLGPIKEI